MLQFRLQCASAGCLPQVLTFYNVLDLQYPVKKPAENILLTGNSKHPGLQHFQCNNFLYSCTTSLHHKKTAQAPLEKTLPLPVHGVYNKEPPHTFPLPTDSFCVYAQQLKLEAFWCAAYDAVSMQKQLEIDFAITVLLFLSSSISSLRNARLNILQ